MTVSFPFLSCCGANGAAARPFRAQPDAGARVFRSGRGWQPAARKLDRKLKRKTREAGHAEAVYDHKPGGIASGLQPSGTSPGKTPAAGKGSIGTGGGSTAGKDTGNLKRRKERPSRPAK
jgi:hypothetical protein